MLRFFFFVILILDFGAGCAAPPEEEPHAKPEEPSGPGVGEEGGPCDTEGECLGELTCMSNACANAGADTSTGLMECTNNECIYLDTALGVPLTWQGCPEGQSGEDCGGEAADASWQEAVDICENLTLGGFDDWVLPNIDELRSLIRGCSITEAGGSCSITHQCSYSVNDNCSEEGCAGCEPWSGPRRDGCFLPANMPGICRWFWSSSLLSEFYAYDISFGHSDVSYGNLLSGELGSRRQVRCVRSRY